MRPSHRGFGCERCVRFFLLGRYRLLGCTHGFGRGSAIHQREVYRTQLRKVKLRHGEVFAAVEQHGNSRLKCLLVHIAKIEGVLADRSDIQKTAHLTGRKSLVGYRLKRL